MRALRAAEAAVRDIRKVAHELRRVGRAGLPYSGPVIEWQSGTLAATRPEPHIALDAEYLETNDIAVDRDYIQSLASAVTFEWGYRERVLDEQIDLIDTRQTTQEV